MSIRNSISLIGYVGGDPVLHQFKKSKKVIFRLATVDRLPKKGEDLEPDWHNITAWNELGDNILSMVKKGDLLSILGSLKYESYQKEDVQVRSAVVRVDEFYKLNKKQD